MGVDYSPVLTSENKVEDCVRKFRAPEVVCTLFVKRHHIYILKLGSRELEGTFSEKDKNGLKFRSLTICMITPLSRPVLVRRMFTFRGKQDKVARLVMVRLPIHPSLHRPSTPLLPYISPNIRKLIKACILQLTPSKYR